MSFVLDASVSLAWCFQDQASDYADGVLERLRTSDAFVAPLWGFEVANALAGAERRGRIHGDEVPAVVEMLLSLPIVVDPVSRRVAVTSTYRLAREHRLTAFAAAYLDVAIRLELPLATLDVDLARAADDAGVGHFRILGGAF